MALAREFRQFLENYRIAGLAIAFVIGVAVKDLVSATVDDLVMPVVEVFLPGGAWETAVVKVYGVELALGHFLASLIDFVVVAFLVFLAVRYLPEKDLEKM